MSKVPPLDLSFLLLESPTRQMHMTAKTSQAERFNPEDTI
jgi:hypothetical protein